MGYKFLLATYTAMTRGRAGASNIWGPTRRPFSRPALDVAPTANPSVRNDAN